MSDIPSKPEEPDDVLMRIIEPEVPLPQPVYPELNVPASAEVAAEQPAPEPEEPATHSKGKKLPNYGIEVDLHEGKFDPNKVRFLVYADSGAGKTVFAATWPQPIFLDIDKGMASIEKKVYRIPIDDFDQLIGALSFLERERTNFKTVVLDSLNEMQNLIMRNTVARYPTIRRAYDDLPSQSDYGKVIDEFDKQVRRLKALPYNLVLIANASSQEYETDIVGPQLVGRNTAKNICRMVDVVGYLYKKEPAGGGGTADQKTRVLVFDAVQYTTKDRSGVLPVTVENPSYKTLYGFWSARFGKKE